MPSRDGCRLADGVAMRADNLAGSDLMTLDTCSLRSQRLVVVGPKEAARASRDAGVLTFQPLTKMLMTGFAGLARLVPAVFERVLDHGARDLLWCHRSVVTLARPNEFRSQP